MYLRFVVAEIDDDSERALGVFHAVRYLREAGKLYAYEEDQHNIVRSWFSENLERPTRFTAGDKFTSKAWSLRGNPPQGVAQVRVRHIYIDLRVSLPVNIHPEGDKASFQMKSHYRKRLDQRHRAIAPNSGHFELALGLSGDAKSRVGKGEKSCKACENNWSHLRPHGLSVTDVQVSEMLSERTRLPFAKIVWLAVLVHPGPPLMSEIAIFQQLTKPIVVNLLPSH